MNIVKLKSISIKITLITAFSLLFSGCGTASKSALSITGGAPSYKFSNTGMSRTNAGDLELAAAVLDGLVYLVTSSDNSDRNSDAYIYGLDGFDDNNIHKDTGTKYDKDGYNYRGYNKNGYNKNGFDKKVSIKLQVLSII